jgi:queuine tRNA-ribosyltransferase
MLNTRHNLHYYLNLMAGAREAIEQGRFAEYRADFLRQRRNDDARM